MSPPPKQAGGSPLPPHKWRLWRNRVYAFISLIWNIKAAKTCFLSLCIFLMFTHDSQHFAVIIFISTHFVHLLAVLSTYYVGFTRFYHIFWIYIYFTIFFRSTTQACRPVDHLCCTLVTNVYDKLTF